MSESQAFRSFTFRLQSSSLILELSLPARNSVLGTAFPGLLHKMTLKHPSVILVPFALFFFFFYGLGLRLKGFSCGPMGGWVVAGAESWI